jgi:uncharacterized protein YndB with AHSA1/START domain
MTTLHEISSVERRVGERVLPAGDARVLAISRVYDTDVHDLWDACTSPERIPRWFLPITGDLRVGGRYQLEGQAGGTIQECEPPHRLAATWEYGGEVSWIELRLAPVGDGRTRLQLEHTAHVDDARWAQFGPGAMGVGWDLLLATGLVRYLSTRAPVDPQAAAAWTMFDDGREFISQSSAAWAAASIAAGMDREVARAAAERITAFYTGAGDPTASTGA